MAISVRVRFEVFKRDDFTCRYCGRRSPEVVLEVDHIVASSLGGADDPINLATSCWECNHGKSDKPLATVMTAEDPHEKAIELLERSRQLDEYNRVLSAVNEQLEHDAWELAKHWIDPVDDEDFSIRASEFAALKNALRTCPREKIREFMDLAIAARKTRHLAYVMACIRNWRTDQKGRIDGVA